MRLENMVRSRFAITVNFKVQLKAVLPSTE